MFKHIALCYLFFVLSFLSYEKAVAKTESGEYESADGICEKCNCTDLTEATENNEIFTIDCSMKDLEKIISEWPKDIESASKEIIYIMSFNTIAHLPQFPSTDSIIFFSCKHCKMSELSVNTFIDTKNIMSLDLSYNQITSASLHPDIFRGPHEEDEYSPIHLQILDLSHNKIGFLDERLFEHTPYLRTVILSNNNLKEITDGTLRTLASCHDLEVLHLEQTGISELPVELFENMKHLSELNLNGNNFLEVPASLSNVGSSLEILLLNNNPIESITSGSFEKLQKLELLSISFMPELISIETGSFGHLEALESLLCKGNGKLSEMNLEDLLKLLNLKSLDISSNQLKNLNFGEIIDVEKSETPQEYFRNLHTLKLAGNPWHCDCSIIKSLQFFNHNSTFYKKAEKFDEARCNSPNDLLSKLLYILPTDYICAADQKSKPMKIPVYETPQFLRPKSLMLTVASIVIVIVLGVVIGILIVCISRRIKGSAIDNSNQIRYSAVRHSSVLHVVNINHNQQQP